MNGEEVMRAAFEAVYDHGTDWATAADYIKQNAPERLNVFIDQWRAEEGEFATPQTPDDYVAHVEAEAEQVQRTADMIADAQADAAEAEESAELGRMAAVVDALPRGRELAPKIIETVGREVVKAGVPVTPEGLVPILTDAYYDAGIRAEIEDGAEFHAEETSGFAATIQAKQSGWGKQGDPPVTRASLDADRAWQIAQRKAELLAVHEPPPDVLAQPRRIATEAEETERVKAQFASKSAINFGGALVKTGPGITASQAKARANEGRAGASMAQFEAPNAAYRGAEIPAAEHLMPAQQQPQERPTSTASTPRSWWLHPNEQ